MSRGLKLLLGLIAMAGFGILFMVTAITSVPYFTSKQYAPNEAPSALFYVVLETFNPHLNQLQFQCLRWDDFQKIFPQATDKNVYMCRETNTDCDYPIVPDLEYRAMLSVPKGGCENISSEFKVQHLGAHTQMVRLRWSQEAYRVRNSYSVADKGVIPLHLVKYMSAGICVMIFLVLIIALPLTGLFFHRCHKKYGIYVCTGMAFMLVSLCAFNFARFSHQLYLDPLSENPAVFLDRIKMSTTVAVTLFICAAISFWLHKKKILPTRRRG